MTQRQGNKTRSSAITDGLRDALLVEILSNAVRKNTFVRLAVGMTLKVT